MNNIKDRLKGSLYGFAIGDAMGATTEFMSEDEIKSEYGKSRYIKSIVHKMIFAHFVLLIFNRLLTESIRPITNILLILFSNPETITNATVIGLLLYIKTVN